ncbi:hypothetical protein ACO0QE_003107 [Hanseniaspora vineae]
MSKFYALKAQTKTGADFPFSELKGKVVIIVNTATKCGLTQSGLSGLEELYKKYHADGLEIIGFPCNQFLNQNPESDEEGENFCKLNYGVTFPFMKKCEVNGPNTHPVYDYLKNEKPGIFGLTRIKWNFTKFLIDKEGNVVERYSPSTNPAKLEPKIKELLKA